MDLQLIWDRCALIGRCQGGCAMIVWSVSFVKSACLSRMQSVVRYFDLCFNGVREAPNSKLCHAPLSCAHSHSHAVLRGIIFYLCYSRYVTSLR